MADKKYGYYIKKLAFEKDKGNADYLTWPKGADLEGLNVNFSWGYYTKTGELNTEKSGMHTSPSDTCMVFSGLDYNNPDYLGAELEIVMGEEEEKYIIDTPTVVVIPKELAHSSPVARKVDKTYGILSINLNAESITNYIPGPSKQVKSTDAKYGHLVKKMTMHDTQRKSGGNGDFIAGYGGKTLEGLDLNFTWAFHSGLGKWHEKDPHFHPFDEALVFVGLDPDNPESLGAELEIQMGEEMEPHVFDTAVAIIAPGGFVHCPLITQKVDKPYAFTAICLNGEHGTTWLGGDEK